MFAFSYGYSRVAVSAAVVVVALCSFYHLYRHLFIVFFILRWPGFTCVGPFFFLYSVFTAQQHTDPQMFMKLQVLLNSYSCMIKIEE